MEDKLLKGTFFHAAMMEGKVYTPVEKTAISELIDLVDVRLDRSNWRDHLDLLAEVDILFTSWGPPILDAAFLESAPRLRHVFHAAGSIKEIMTEAAWERNIGISSGYAANAIPVAEYTLSQILFCLKNGWQLAHACTPENTSLWRDSRDCIGTFGSKVGLVSLGMIGRKVVDLLRPFDIEVIAYDIHPDEEIESSFGVKAATLEEIFSTCDCISLHAPLLPETVGMIRGENFRSMKTGASLINTARGAIIRHDEMIEVLHERPDITVVLDVTHPEPPRPSSELYRLPNVFLTPHIAGSRGGDRRRIGSYMVHELKRYLSGKELLWSISESQLKVLG